MSRSTFSILPYINRQKVKADGTANILCRITIDGKSAAISTGISCTPQEWNAKKGEVRNARDNGRLASFLAEVKDKYNSLLTTNGNHHRGNAEGCVEGQGHDRKVLAELW